MFDTRFYPYPDHRYLWGQDVDEEIKSQHPRYKYTNYICFSCKHKADGNPYCECCEHCNKYEGSIIRTEECLNMNYKGTQSLPKIENVIFNGPATIVFWADGTKTVVKCQEDDAFDPNTGLAHAISKKALGNSYKKEFKKWTEKYNVTRPLVLTDEALEKLRANLLARLKGE